MKRVLVALFLLLILVGAAALFLLRTRLISIALGSYNPTIEVQPFDDISSEQVNNVFEKIKKTYPKTILLKPVKLPENSFYAPRARFKADTIIKWLSKRTERNFVSIGITSKDISTSKGSVQDWGIMGLGFQPGNACVVSSYRLNKNNLSEQLYKVCIHEIGHTQGLAHCNNKTCFMRDAEGHNTTDEEYEYCQVCRNKLADKGWSFPY